MPAAIPDFCANAVNSEPTEHARQAEAVALVRRGCEIKRQSRELNAELAGISARLLAFGPGVYVDAVNHTSCTVVQPQPKFTPDADAVEEIRELLGDDDTFRKLFERKVSWTPLKAVRQIAAALLTPGKLKKFIALGEVSATGFVIWPK